MQAVTEMNTGKEPGSLCGITSPLTLVLDQIKQVVRIVKLIHMFWNSIMWEPKQTKYRI
jgi:hypothetical protein